MIILNNGYTGNKKSYYFHLKLRLYHKNYNLIEIIYFIQIDDISKLIKPRITSLNNEAP